MSSWEVVGSTNLHISVQSVLISLVRCLNLRGTAGHAANFPPLLTKHQLERFCVRVAWRDNGTTMQLRHTVPAA